MPPIDYADPWILERSRAMCAELDAATQAECGAIQEKHLRAALAERPAVADEVQWAERLRSALLFAAPCVEMTSAQWAEWLERMALPVSPEGA